jgi:hypothetical protein
MDDKRFNELLNEYLDGEINATDKAAFEQALQSNSRYRALWSQHRRMHTAQIAAIMRSPRLQARLFTASIGRLCRGVTLLSHLAIFVFSISLFQSRETFNTDLPPLAINATSPTASIEPRTPALPAQPESTTEATSEFLGQPTLDSLEWGVNGLSDEYSFVRL